MYAKLKDLLTQELDAFRASGLYKEERVIESPQGPRITVKGRPLLNFCANNYLGLSSHPKVIEAAHKALDEWGYGMSSVRFICGTQEIHKQLERKVADFLRQDDAILYAACFDANGGVFEPFMSEDCAIITDALNHASIIDGVRLTKAQRLIYQHADMNDLENKLKQSRDAMFRMIVTDGVFSMDGDIAHLKEICMLSEWYEAIVMVDDSHATGFIGPTGRGTPEYWDVESKVDVITTTFGKALGGASGGATVGHREMIDMLRQRSRPYLFSNTLAPAVVGATLAVLDLLSESDDLRKKLQLNTKYFRDGMARLGFDIRPGVHPIVPIMLYEAKAAVELASRLLDEGIYVIAFSYPVVPKGQARIRVQISAAHEQDHLDRALEAFGKVGRELGVIG
ncbi:MAG: glycine C-acetyltransferase [Candidatus Zixiibacteriota bacterium]|nr:MAG: glycine C-acetyltransferase [candidate division Zixibacteria bacterium]